jgi:hypothetical protein
VFVTPWLALVLMIAASTSCAGAPPAKRSFAVIFVVESDPGVWLGKAEVFIGGKSIGVSDSQGRLHATIYGQAHEQVRVEHRCPEGHKAPAGSKVLKLRHLEDTDATGSLSLEITLRCRPEQRLAIFVVRAKNGSGLPVLLDGENVADTNGSGVAHFSTWGAPGTEYVIELDTTERPRLLPQSPTHLFALPDADEIFMVDQSFDLKKEWQRRRYRRTRITKIE